MQELTHETMIAVFEEIFGRSLFWLMVAMTRSRLSDIGGPVDVMLLLGIAALGAVGMAILVYTVEALIGSRRTTGGGDVR